jgi:hypothetical protein
MSNKLPKNQNNRSSNQPLLPHKKTMKWQQKDIENRDQIKNKNDILNE